MWEHVTSDAIIELLDDIQEEERESYHELNVTVWNIIYEDFAQFCGKRLAEYQIRNHVRKWLLKKLLDVKKQEEDQKQNVSIQEARRNNHGKEED